jgi:hypothetical protein
VLELFDVSLEFLSRGMRKQLVDLFVAFRFLQKI